MQKVKENQSISVSIRCYGPFKDYFDESFSLDLTEGAAVRDLFISLKEKNPRAASLVDASRAAVGDEFAAGEYILKDADEIFLLPPASGG